MWTPYRSYFNPMTGEEITEEDILYCWVAWRCMTIRGEAVGKLPRYLYKEIGEDHYVKAKTHPNYKVISMRPNPYMDWAEYDCMRVIRLDMYGNSYDQIVRNGRGDIIALYPLHPSRITLKWIDGSLQYEYMQENGSPKPLGYRDVHRIAAPSQNGLVGVANCTVATRAIALAKNIDEYKARYFENDATPPYVFAADGPIAKDKKLEIFNLFQEQFGGIKNKHKGGAILDMGLKPYPIASITNRDGQFSEGEERNGCAIAGAFGVQQHKLGFLSRSTNNNIQHQGAEFFTDAVDPLITRIQEAEHRDLVPEKDQATHFPEYDVDELLWIDVEKKGEDTRKNVLSGIWTVNEGRAKTKKPPREGWDVLLIPTANAPDGKPIVAPEPEGDDKEPDDKKKEEKKPVKEKDKAALADELFNAADSENRLRTSMVILLVDAINPLIAREVDEIEGTIKRLRAGKDVVPASVYMSDFYATKFKSFLEHKLAAPVEACASLVPALDQYKVSDLVDDLVSRQVNLRKKQVVEISAGEDSAGYANALERWLTKSSDFDPALLAGLCVRVLLDNKAKAVQNVD